MASKTQNFDLTEADFIQMAQNLKKGNTELFEQIFLEHFDACLTYVRKNYRASYDDAYDATMETMLIFRQRIVDDKIKYGNLRFLYTRMAAQLYMRNNKKSSMLVDEISHDLPDIEESFIPHEDSEILEKAWQQLGANCQELLKQHYYQNMSLNEVAENSGRTPAAVRKQKERCKNKLTELFKKHS